jgi:hypothetical protein
MVIGLRLNDKGNWQSIGKTSNGCSQLWIMRETTPQLSPPANSIDIRRTIMKTVTGIFDSYNDAKAAVSALEEFGIPSYDISIVSNDAYDRDIDASRAATGAGAGAGIGAVVGGTGGLLTGLGMIAIPGVGPVVAAGWLAATAVGTVAGAAAGSVAGGLIGAMTDSGVPEADAHVYAESIRRGGTLVTAKVNDTSVADVDALFERFKSVDPVERRNAYVGQGWERFDETLDSNIPGSIEQERRRFR